MARKARHKSVGRRGARRGSLVPGSLEQGVLKEPAEDAAFSRCEHGGMTAS